MGWRGKRNALVNEASLCCSHPQDKIACTITVDGNTLDRSPGIQLSQAMETVATAVTSTTDATQPALTAPPEHTVDSCAKGIR